MNQQLDEMQLQLEKGKADTEAETETDTKEDVFGLTNVEDTKESEKKEGEEVPATATTDQEVAGKDAVNPEDGDEEVENDDGEEDYYAELSSGLESDREFDLLVEQEVLTAIAMRRQKKPEQPASGSPEKKANESKPEE